MKNQTCNGCLTSIKQGFVGLGGKHLFCTQSCEQDFYENGGKPTKRRRQPRSSS